jgi:hypothetical protein
MSTTVSLPRSVSRRTQILASASALVAAASVAVTLAVAGGDGDTAAQPSAAPATAQPNLATLYRNESAMPQPVGPDAGSAAERFHHFR